jgi:16S rRNA G966 N2-methylase RsmD
MKRDGNNDSQPQSKRYRLSSSSSGGGGLTAQEREIIRSRDELFRGIPSNLRNQIQLDSVATFSVTESEMADQMTKTILKHYSSSSLMHKEMNELKILDGMACVGGNTISFAKFFPSVLSNEFNESRYNMLVNNVKNVMNQQNVQFFNGSILDLAFQESYDILFLDPEWGGPDYKFKRNIKLTISDMPLEEFCLNVFEKCTNVEMIALKLPVNYHNVYLRDLMKSKNVTYIFDNTFDKMTLTVLLRPPHNPLVGSQTEPQLEPSTSSSSNVAVSSTPVLSDCGNQSTSSSGNPPQTNGAMEGNPDNPNPPSPK